MPHPPFQSQHVLVIDHDQAILQLFGDVLGDAGYRVTLETFKHPTSGLLKTIQKLQPDLVLMELVVERELKGWDLLQHLRTDPATRDIPVVLCTGMAGSVTASRLSLDAMGVPVVLKPFDIDTLLTTVDSATGSRPLQNLNHVPPVVSESIPTQHP